MGGFVLAQMAVRHPQKVRAAAFVSTHAGADGPETQEARRKMMRLVMDEGAAALARGRDEKLFSPAYIQKHPEEVAENLRHLAAQSPVSIARRIDAMRRREDMTPRLGEIACPCAVIGGTLDALISPESMRALHEGLPDSTLEMIEGAGHLLPQEAPERVNDALKGLMQRAGMGGVGRAPIRTVHANGIDSGNFG